MLVTRRSLDIFRRYPDNDFIHEQCTWSCQMKLLKNWSPKGFDDYTAVVGKGNDPRKGFRLLKTALSLKLKKS